MDAEKEVFIYGNKETYERGKDPSFACGCIANGIDKEIAEEIWGQMEKFAAYAFNRSHAACYAFLACITAYMRCYWPAEFYAAMCNAFIENADSLRSYLSQATHAGIKLMPPDVNKSNVVFTPEKGAIRYGLGGISGIKGQAGAIVGERMEHGPYLGVQDMFTRIADRDSMLSKTVIEGLVYSGALSEFSSNKNSLLAAFPILQKSYKSNATNRVLSQISFFGENAEDIELPIVPSMERNAELQKEHDVLGVYLSGHPAQEVISILSSNKDGKTLEELCASGEKKYVATGGVIRNSRIFYTKKGDQMASFLLESQFASISCVVFPSNMVDCLDEITDQALVVITGSYVCNRDGDGMQFIVSTITPKQAYHGLADPFVVNIHSKVEQQVVLDFIRKYPGPHRVVLSGNGKEVELNRGVNMTLKVLDYLSGAFRSELVSTT